MEKEEEFEFDFQRFLKEQKLTVKDLPKQLKKMVRLIERLLHDAQKDCDKEDCKAIIRHLQPMADFVMDELFAYTEELAKSASEDETDSQEDKNEVKPPTDEEIIATQYQRGNRKLSRQELLDLGIKTPLESRYVFIGRYCLVHIILSDYWYIYRGSELNS
mgnify:CR=1 FL=1